MSRYTVESRNGHSLSDREYYQVIARARRLHAEAFDRALRQLAGLLGKLISQLRDWRDKRRAADELNAMDDRGLRDIGLSRADINTAVYGHPVGFTATLKRLMATFESARQGKVARDELMHMDDRSLEDLGLNRADVAYYTSGTANRGAANEDRRVA